MALNENDRRRIEKEATERNKVLNPTVKVTFLNEGKAVKLNTSVYTDAHLASKSKQWG